MSHEVEKTNTGWCKKNPSIFEFPPTNPGLPMDSPSALTELPSWTFEGNFSHFLYSKLIWERHSTYLQIAFSQEFSLPVAKLVSSASEKAMDVADFAASPKTHTNAMMLLASILQCLLCLIFWLLQPTRDSKDLHCSLSAPVVTCRPAPVGFLWLHKVQGTLTIRKALVPRIQNKYFWQELTPGPTRWIGVIVHFWIVLQNSRFLQEASRSPLIGL